MPAEIRQAMRGVLTEEGVEKWWIRPNPRLPDGRSPQSCWSAGMTHDVLELVDGYLRPEFT